MHRMYRMKKKLSSPAEEESEPKQLDSEPSCKKKSICADDKVNAVQSKIEDETPEQKPVPVEKLSPLEQFIQDKKNININDYFKNFDEMQAAIAENLAETLYYKDKFSAIAFSFTYDLDNLPVFKPNDFFH